MRRVSMPSAGGVSSTGSADLPRRLPSACFVALLAACRGGEPAETPAPAPAPAEPAAPAVEPVEDGTFEGRAIAPTMSYLGADWLTREERIAEEDPDALHRELA